MQTPVRSTIGQRRLSARKRHLFGCATAIGTYAIIELICFAILAKQFDGFSSNQARCSLIAGTNDLGTGESAAVDILHPYLGFVRQPRPDNNAAAPEDQVSDWGFAGKSSPIQQRGSGKFVIGILGGSVAEEFANAGEHRFCDALQRSSQFAGKQIILVRLALKGYKQPQQLMLLNFLLSQGAEFDVIVNIDGFNEVTLPALENVPHGVFASYPRSWQMQVASSKDPSALRLIGRLTLRKELSRVWATRVSGSPARYSPAVLLMWRAYEDALWRGTVRDYRSLSVMLPQQAGFCATGPVQKFATTDDLMDHCAEVWMRSSLQLHHLAAANGMRYYHFLQPNQYLPGSKNMGAEEQREAYSERQLYRPFVERGYPWLRRYGAQLKAQGVQFHDLTQLFASQPLATYRDNCCHYNVRGNEMLADEIARVILTNRANRTE